MEISLKDRVERWLKTQTDWVASGTIQRVAAEATAYTPSNVSRRLRELENEGRVKVKYEKGHAFYKSSNEQESIISSVPESVRMFDSLRS